MTTSVSAGPTSPIISLDHVHLAYPGAAPSTMCILHTPAPMSRR